MGFGDRVGVQRVVHPAAFLAAGDDTGVGQSFEMPGEARLGHVELGHQVADAAFAGQEERDDVEPDLVGEGVEERGGSGGVSGESSGHKRDITGFLDGSRAGFEP